jgi:hypothetical protein
MLTSKGLLTDIGSWYLGGAATNNIPSSASRAALGLENLLLVVVTATVAGACLI